MLLLPWPEFSQGPWFYSRCSCFFCRCWWPCSRPCPRATWTPSSRPSRSATRSLPASPASSRPCTRSETSSPSSSCPTSAPGVTSPSGLAWVSHCLIFFVLLACRLPVLNGFDRHFQASVHFTLSSVVNKSKQHQQFPEKSFWDPKNQTRHC